MVFSLHGKSKAAIGDICVWSYGTIQIVIHHPRNKAFKLGNKDDEIFLSSHSLSNESNLFQLKKFFLEIWMKM